MSWLNSPKALHDENKRFRRSSRIMKKTKIPSNLKTRRCSLTEKGTKCLPAQHTVFKGKQKFSLCPRHFELHERRND